MALIVQVKITTTGGGLLPVEMLEIRRLESLWDRGHPDDEVHQYLVVRYDHAGADLAEAWFEHRYGDGAWKCTQLALHALEVASP